MKKLFSSLLFLVTMAVYGQTTAPSISYQGGTYSYQTGTAITPITVTNSGGYVPNLLYSKVTGYSFGLGVVAANLTYYDGALYGSFGTRVFKINIPTASNKAKDTLTTTLLAGSTTAGYADGNGANAKFRVINGIAVNPNTGDVFVSDMTSGTIRKIDPNSGDVTTYAGKDSSAFKTRDGALLDARFGQPWGLCFDSDGNLYVKQAQYQSIRIINTTSGQVSTMVSPSSKWLNGRYMTYMDGNLYSTEETGHKVDKTAIISYTYGTLAGSGVSGYADGTGLKAQFNTTRGITHDLFGNLYVCDYNNFRIRKIASDSTVTTLAGSGTNTNTDGVGVAAGFRNPTCITFDGEGTLYVSDQGSPMYLRTIPIYGYKVEPALPAGLSIDGTGTISGTPTAEATSQVYTVTAVNPYGASTANITLGVITGLPSLSKTEVSVFTRENEIVINGEILSRTTATLYDIQGKKLLTELLSKGSVNTIPTLGFQKGLYILSIKNEGNSQVIKIKID
jgi:mucin-19